MSETYWVNLDGDYRTDHVLPNPLPDYLDEKDISGWYKMVKISDVKSFYESVLERTGGPLPWSELEKMRKILNE